MKPQLQAKMSLKYFCQKLLKYGRVCVCVCVCGQCLAKPQLTTDGILQKMGLACAEAEAAALNR